MSRRFDRALGGDFKCNMCRYDLLSEAATDQTLVEPNWEGILECVDMIRGSDVGVKQAVQSIQKRYHNENPHVSHHALLVLEACVKNCGKKVDLFSDSLI
jgi:growth factor-regulated tyrosine kinase substrate